MGAWGTAIFSDDLAQDVRREYRILLSVGESNESAEEMLISHYSSILNCNDPDEDVFWFALALCEWKVGRLSQFAKSKALQFLNAGRDLERWKSPGNEKNYKNRIAVLKEFQTLILSPMPPVKKIPKPSVHRCPWKVGSLLAYRIVSNKERLRDNPCFMKYVLLRVVRIKKEPISRMFNTEYYDEEMLIGLYDWIGDEIPSPEIVKGLEYIAIEEYAPSPPRNTIDTSLFNVLPEESCKILENGLRLFFTKQVEKCVWFNWMPSKNVPGDITLLDCDETFLATSHDFFSQPLDSRTITSFLPFDMDLSKKFQHKFA